MVLDTRSIGIVLETHKEDNDEVSKKVDWGMVFMLLKNRGFSHKEILELSYPQFNAYMKNINNVLTYNMIIPYLGSNEEEQEEIETTDINGEKKIIKRPKIEKTGSEIQSREELLSVIAQMNSDFTR